MDRRIARSVQIEAAIEAALTGGVAGPDQLSELGRLGAQLILQRAVEDEVATFLGRLRYARTPEAAGSRNGTCPRRVQTAEGELVVAMPQVRGTLTRFVSSVIPDTKAIIRTRPLEALVIGAYVRGLSDRDIESLTREAGLGSISRTAVSTVCRELRDRYRAFRAKSLRRRTKVIGRFPGETSCLTMAWAVMDLVIAGARGLGLTLPDRHAIAGMVAGRAVPEIAEAIA